MNSMKINSEYFSSGSFWWLDLEDDADRRHVPLNVKRIETIVAHYYESPNRLPQPVTIAMQTATEMPKFGKLRVLSPIEFVHAFIMAVHAATKKNDPDTLGKWRRMMFMTPLRFTICFKLHR